MAKFGWCLTNQHEMCTTEFGNTKCECTCGESHGVDAASKKNNER